VVLRDSSLNFESVKDVLDYGLCTGCGTCVGICPHGVLEMSQSSDTAVPTLSSSSLCVGCRLCLRVCPGISLNFKSLNEAVFGKQPIDLQLGNHVACYLGWTLDPEIRRVSSSGGLVTSLLAFLLESEEISGALVTRMNRARPFQADAFLARTREEVLEAAGSKYLQVATNVAIKDIRRQEGKFVVVGLPCHIHGFRNAERFDARLKAKIVAHFGLFCGHTVNSAGLYYLLEKLNVEKHDVVRIRYRTKGWPGGLLVDLKDGSRIFYPHSSYWNNLFGLLMFTPRRCLFCADGTNEFADLSFGDAWLPELKSERGASVVVSRSVVGERLLSLTRALGAVELVRIKSAKVIQSQKGMLRFKKRKLRARLMIARMIRIEPPRIVAQLPNPEPIDYLSGFFPFLVAASSSSERLRRYSRTLGYITRLFNAF